ncbi:MAG: DUF523 domain-containing protein [Desulfarculus sp.]|nr:DUF523 domain-containing protein [Desulfarculus sp.]
MILVSACLWGLCTRYDSRVLAVPTWLAQLPHADILALCPEVLGGLTVPRPAARIVGATPGREGTDVLAGRARVLTAEGLDVSAAFIAGAQAVLARALAAGVRRAYLKDRSPSCAHDPQGHNPRGGPGQGVLTALLLAQGIEVMEVRA